MNLTSTGIASNAEKGVPGGLRERYSSQLSSHLKTRNYLSCLSSLNDKKCFMNNPGSPQTRLLEVVRGMMGSRGRNDELENYPQNGNHKQRKKTCGSMSRLIRRTRGSHEGGEIRTLRREYRAPETRCRAGRDVACLPLMTAQ